MSWNPRGRIWCDNFRWLLWFHCYFLDLPFYGCCFHYNINRWSLRKPKKCEVRLWGHDTLASSHRICFTWSGLHVGTTWCCFHEWMVKSGSLSPPKCPELFCDDWSTHLPRKFWIAANEWMDAPNSFDCIVVCAMGILSSLKIWPMGGAVILWFTVKDTTFIYTFSKFFSLSHAQVCCLQPKD